MMRTSVSRTAIGAVAVYCLLFAAAPAVQAVDVEKKWRLGFSLGGLNNQDKIESDAGNSFTVVDRDFEFAAFYFDPRDDSAVFNDLDINSGGIATLSLQYAITKILIAEVSAGYQKADVGDIELQVQADNVVPDAQIESFDFSIFQIPAGELERIPVQLSLMARFRPRANFNPYFGAGAGYSFIGFEPSEELNALSRNLDASLGAQAVLTTALNANPSMSSLAEPIGDLTGATVDARDTFEWNAFLGAELSFAKNWVVFLDLRHTFSSRALSFSFNGEESLGRSVPNLTDFSDSPLASEFFGAVAVTDGGIVDAGSFVPIATAPPDTDCADEPQLCFFDTSLRDGELDTGLYYIQGGSVSYDAFSVQVGLRFTF